MYTRTVWANVKHCDSVCTCTQNTSENLVSAESETCAHGYQVFHFKHVPCSYGQNDTYYDRSNSLGETWSLSLWPAQKTATKRLGDQSIRVRFVYRAAYSAHVPRLKCGSYLPTWTRSGVEYTRLYLHLLYSKTKKKKTRQLHDDSQIDDGQHV